MPWRGKFTQFNTERGSRLFLEPLGGLRKVSQEAGLSFSHLQTVPPKLLSSLGGEGTEAAYIHYVQLFEESLQTEPYIRSLHFNLTWFLSPAMQLVDQINSEWMERVCEWPQTNPTTLVVTCLVFLSTWCLKHLHPGQWEGREGPRGPVKRSYSLHPTFKVLSILI